MSFCFSLLFALVPAVSQAQPVQKKPVPFAKALRPSQVPALLRYSRLPYVPLQDRIGLLRKAIASSQAPGFPKGPRLLMQTQIGMLLLAARQPSKALQSFVKVMKDLSPSQVDLLGRSLLGRGQALVALGRIKEALQALHSVKRLCPGTIYAKQAQKTLLIVKNLRNRKLSSLSLRIPIHLRDLKGKKSTPTKVQIILLVASDPKSFLSKGTGKLLAKKILSPESFALAFTLSPKNLGRQLHRRLRRFEEETGISIFLFPPEIKKALERVFPIQSPKSLLLSIKGRILDMNPSPSRCAAFVAANKKGL